MNPRKCTSYNGVFENDKCTIPCKLLKDNKIETTDIDFINNDKCFLTGTGSVRQINNQDQYHDIIQKHQKCFNINSKYDRNIGVSTGNGTREVIPYHIDSIPTKSQYYVPKADPITVRDDFCVISCSNYEPKKEKFNFYPSINILKSNNIILTQIITTLHFDNL